MKTIDTEKKPIKLWLDEIDSDTLAQAKNLANLPFVHSHIAIMPDAHVGYGMPIGGVAATRGVVIPNAVGVDIGCGVQAVQTSLRSLTKAQLRKLLQAIRKNVPLGFKHHKKPQSTVQMPALTEGWKKSSLQIVCHEYENGRLQLGTLGGGNHFIEIQQGDDGLIWLMVHSGS
ncbi:MAG: RtcB family protein, partial [Desulforhopalus sp.]